MSYNLQGILRANSINITTEFQKLGYITQNISNAYTNGYKALRFDEIIDADGSIHATERKNISVGNFMITNRPLDVALTVSGFIPVTSTEGEIRYTRDGSFTINKDGYLVTKTGELVGSGIVIDTTAQKTEIRPNGDVYSYARLQDEPKYVGTIPVVQFKNPEAMKDVGANEFIPTPDAGEMKLAVGENLMKQNGVETSNTDIVSEVYSITRANASVLASSKLMQTVNSMYSEAIRLTEW